MRRFAVVALSVLAASAVVYLALPFILNACDRGPPVCVFHVKSLAAAMQMYAEDYDGGLPADAWCDRLVAQGYATDPDVFRCDRAPSLRCAYAYNSALVGANLKQLPAPGLTVVIFESDRGWNASGGMKLLPSEPRHYDGDYYGFADGRAKWVKRSPFIIWNPAPSPKSPVPSP